MFILFTVHHKKCKLHFLTQVVTNHLKFNHEMNPLKKEVLKVVDGFSSGVELFRWVVPPDGLNTLTESDVCRGTEVMFGLPVSDQLPLVPIAL